MHLYSLFKIGFIGLIVSISSGHVLHASNVEEFRNLAKKLVPGNIADKLVEIVSQNKYDHDNSEYQVDDVESKDDDVYYYEGYEDDRNDESFRDNQHESKPLARQGVNAADPEIINRGPQEVKEDTQRPEPIEVNLDDLVEKVRDKLLDNFQKNPTELQKFLGAQSVIANFRNETDRNENNKKRKLLRDRHDEKQYQPSRNGHKNKISRHQPINIERKDTRDRPAQIISRPPSSKIKRNYAQTYKQDDLFSPYRPGPAISRPLSSIIDRTDAQRQVYEEVDQPARYRPEPGILRPVSSNIDKKVAQGQTYYEEDDLLARFKPGSGISRPASIIDKKDVLGQAYVKENQPARYRPGPIISRPVSSIIEKKDSQVQEYEEDGFFGPEISRPLPSNRPGSEFSRPQSINRERKDVEGQAYVKEVLPARYRPRQIISKPQSSNREKKASKVQAYKEDDLPEEDAEGNVRVPKDQRQTTESELIFQEFNLNSKKNEKDTYEDYVTPKREGNIFISEEAETATKQVRSSLIWSQRTERTPKLDIFNYKLQNALRNSFSSQTSERTNPEIPVNLKNPSIYDDSNETSTEPDLKARTENLWFDYKDEPIAKVKQKLAQVSANGETKQVKLGTMIPTRETYKMTSPNYYGQLPTVAEKYNFDEPIPERDREKEDLKPIGNPPANINGKIKV